MARKPNPGDAVSTGYLYDETQKTFAVGDDWTRQEVATLRRLGELDHPLSLLTAADAQAVIAGWSDDDLQAVDIWCLDSEHDGLGAGDFPNVPLNPPPPTLTGDDTIQASGDDTVQASGGDDTVQASTGDDTVQASGGGDAVQTSAAMPAEHLAALRDMRESRYGLYKYPQAEGDAKFGATGPTHAGDVVRDLEVDGLCVVDLTGGSHGSVKITDAGRAALARVG